MAVGIQLRRDLAAQWTSVNPILTDGEVGIEKDTSKLKIGNGASGWTSLPYFVGNFSALSSQLSDLISAHNALSNRVSVNSAAGGGGSVTSDEVSAVSATAKAAIDVVSNQVSVLSSQVSVLSQQVSVISQQVSALSQAHSVLSQAHSVLSNAVSAETVSRIAGDNALSVKIDTVSNQVSVLSQAISVLSQQVSTISQNLSVVSNAASNALSVANAASNAASIVSVAAAAADSHANTASVAATSVNARVNSVVSTLISALSVADIDLSERSNSIVTRLDNVSSKSAATSVRGLQSVVNALSNRISGLAVGAASVTSAEHLSVDDRVSILSTNYTSLVNRVSANSAVGGGGSVTSNEVSAVSAQAASAINVVSNALSAEMVIRAASINAEASARDVADQDIVASINAVSARVVSVSAELASLVQIASLAATSADGHANTVSARVVSVSAEVASLLASVEARLSDRIDAIPGGGSTNVVGYVSTANVICAAALTNISGLTVSVSAGVLYELKGMIMYSTSATTGHAFGLTFPAMTHAAGGLEGNKSVNPSGTSTFSLMEFGSFDGTDSGSAVWSAAVGGAGLLFLRINGTLLPSSGGLVIPQARASVATNAVTIVRGSWMRVFRLS